VTPGYKYWFSAALADSGQAWAADSALFVLAQMEGPTGFNITLPNHYQVVKIYFKFFGASLIKLTLDFGYEKYIYLRFGGHAWMTGPTSN
jgi:hypothetical protein